MATHVALESVHHLHRVHDVVAGGWAHHLRCRTLAGSASCVGNGPAGRAGQAADHRSCPGPQEVRKYRSLHSLPCGVHSSVCSTPPGAPAAAARCERSCRSGPPLAGFLARTSAWLPTSIPTASAPSPSSSRASCCADPLRVRMLDAARPTWRLQLRQLGRNGLLCCIGCWWGLAIAGAESALRARGAEQAVELSAPASPAGRPSPERTRALALGVPAPRACVFFV